MASARIVRRWLGRAVLAAALTYAVAGWFERRLPGPERLAEELERAPVQGPVDRAPFEFVYSGKRHFVRPVARYELWGLVVSHNDIHAFADIYHDASSVDTLDLCVVWGSNAKSGSYRDVEFWSGPFTCYFRYPDGVELDRTAAANNHLITDRDDLRAKLARVHLGDQVHVAGMLVDYRVEDWGPTWRRTSTVRDDSDCEIVFFEDLEVLRANVPGWHAAGWLAGKLLILLPLAWLASVVFEARAGRSSLGELS